MGYFTQKTLKWGKETEKKIFPATTPASSKKDQKKSRIICHLQAKKERKRLLAELKKKTVESVKRCLWEKKTTHIPIEDCLKEGYWFLHLKKIVIPAWWWCHSAWG